MTPPTRLQGKQVTRRLREAGVSPEPTAQLAPLFARAVEVLDRADERRPLHAFFVPGRIEGLGKHTDYAGGSSLTCATERGFALVAASSSDPGLHVHHVRTGESVEIELTPDADAPDVHWARYPATVARRVAHNVGSGLKGGHVAFASTLPQAAGMSSFSAMIVGFFQVLCALNALPEHPLYREHLRPPERQAAYLGAVESGEPFGPFTSQSGVGTVGGSEDHTAILCSVPGRLRLFSYRPTRLEADVPFPDGHVFVVAHSGVVAEKTGAAQDRYNRAARLAQGAAAAWRRATGRDDPHLGAAVESDGFSPERMRRALTQADTPFEPEELLRRFEHFYTEQCEELLRRFEHFYTEQCEVLPAAVEALQSGDLGAFGDHVDRSQRAAEELLGNQVPETEFLARAAREIGAVAASAFGAGFGGSVWALVPESDVQGFRHVWRSRYAGAFPESARRAEFFIERPGPAAFEL